VADLQIETRVDGDLTHLVLSGEFDLAGVHTFERAIAQAEHSGPQTILVDLAELQFMDSSGLRALVSANERAKAAGRRFAIVPGPEHVRRVFEITQLDGQFELVDDASAVASS
jgi:anti-anti-sigma factor